MTETIELRKKPELKFILNADEFKIIDLADPKNNGTYLYSEIQKVELKAEQVNWIFSIFTHIVDLFIGGTEVENYKTKAHLKIKLNKKSFKVWLIDADFAKAEKLTEVLNRKKE